MSARAAANLSYFHSKHKLWLSNKTCYHITTLTRERIYYHFCVLSLLTPYTNQNDTCNEIVIQPRGVCEQAARAIVDLTASYAEVFASEGLSDILPHFVSCAISFLEVRFS
jgi:hypothetical protein